MRPQILFPLFAQIGTLKGVGPRIEPLLAKVAGPLVRDVLFTAPQSLVRRPRVTAAEAVPGEVQTLVLTIDSHQPPFRSNHPWKIIAHDETGFVNLIWFKGHGAHLEKSHPKGAVRAVSGKVESERADRQIVHPDFIVALERLEEIPLIEAVYPATAGLSPRMVRRFALEALEKAPVLPEWQDPAWLARAGWPAWRDAMQLLHHPDSELDLSLLSPARKRLAFDELLAHQLALAQRKAARKSQPAPSIPASDLAGRVEAALPFRLTGAQVRAQAEIRADLASGERMSRLIQGDVGSGKTVVAMLAMADVAEAGFQTALMAPTEILARQHFETLRGPLASQGVEAVLLTGRDRGQVRADKLALISHGAAQVAVGTHALFQDDVVFKALALTVIDEQHRFGVNERGRL